MPGYKHVGIEQDSKKKLCVVNDRAFEYINNILSTVSNFYPIDIH